MSNRVWAISTLLNCWAEAVRYSVGGIACGYKRPTQSRWAQPLVPRYNVWGSRDIRYTPIVQALQQFTVGQGVQELAWTEPTPTGVEHAQTHGAHLLHVLGLGTQGQGDPQVARLSHVR